MFYSKNLISLGFKRCQKTALFLAVLLLMTGIHLKIKPSVILILAFFLYFSNLSGVINFGESLKYGGFPKGFFYLALGYNLWFNKIYIRYPFSLSITLEYIGFVSFYENPLIIFLSALLSVIVPIYIYKTIDMIFVKPVSKICEIILIL